VVVKHTAGVMPSLPSAHYSGAMTKVNHAPGRGYEAINQMWNMWVASLDLIFARGSCGLKPVF
jgi:hypothetical protein